MLHTATARTKIRISARLGRCAVLAAAILFAPALVVAQPAGPLTRPAAPLAGDPDGVARRSAPPRHNVPGTRAAELLRGGPGPDALRGGGGQDTLIGGAGDDTYFVGRGERVIEEPGEGVDTLIFLDNTTIRLPPGVENVVIASDANRPLHGRHMRFLGDAGGPSAIGNELANWMQGSAANNILDGRGGNDVLIGGAGRDVFVFGVGYQHDRIEDFQPGEDKIRLVSGLADWAAIRAALEETTDGTLLRVGRDSLLLVGRRISEISARDFELPPVAAHYQPSFTEGFDAGLIRLDGRAPGGGVWRTRMSQGEGTFMSNNDGQWFVDTHYKGLGLNPFSVADGVLRIEGRWHPELREQLGGREFASGVITTEASFAQLYGFFEARMRLSDWPGGFPAFWLLPTDHSWPPEIDVMEQIAIRPGEIYQMGHILPDVATSDWNVYGLEWTAERIAWFVNGEMTHAVYNHNQHKPMYMILNYALGGGWAGEVRRPASAGGSVGQLEVDWVRSYALRGQAEPPVTRPNDPVDLRFSLGPLALGGVPANQNSWSLRSATTGRLLLRPLDFNFEALTGWVDVTLVNDRAADSFRADVNNGWVGLNMQLRDRDGGSIAADDLTLVEIRLGGSKASHVTLDRSQFGLIETGTGDDVVEIRSQRHWIPGRGHIFDILTGAGADRISGWTEGHSTALMRVEAGPGDDVIIGSAGNDVLAGGPGNDELTGGAGRDTFIFRRGEAGADVVTDFQPNFDLLRLEGYAPHEVQVRPSPRGVLVLVPDQSILLLQVAPENFSIQHVILR